MYYKCRVCGQLGHGDVIKERNGQWSGRCELCGAYRLVNIGKGKVSVLLASDRQCKPDVFTEYGYRNEGAIASDKWIYDSVGDFVIGMNDFRNQGRDIVGNNCWCWVFKDTKMIFAGYFNGEEYWQFIKELERRIAEITVLTTKQGGTTSKLSIRSSK